MLKSMIDKYGSLSVQMKATIWFFVCSVLMRGISVFTTPIFTRLLSTAEYGQFNVFNSWLSIITIFVTLQLAAGVYTMGIVKFREEEKEFTSSMQGLNLLLCLGWTIVYVIGHDFWNSLFSLTTVQMLAMLLMIWSSTAFSFWMTTQRNEFKYKPLVAVTMLVGITQSVVGIICVINATDKVTARILGMALVEVIGYSGFFFIQLRRGKKFYSAKYWKYAVLFNLPLLPHYLSSTILGSSDRIMIQRMVGDSAAGIYSLAYSLSQVMLLVNDSLNKTMSPWLYQKVRERNFDSLPKVVYTSLVIIACANLFLIAAAPEIIAIFAPPQYYEAIYVIPPVAMSVYVTYLYLCFAPFEFYFEKRIWTTIGTLTSAVCNIGLNLIFIRMFGYLAAGYTTLICYAVNSCMHYYFMRRVCKENLDDLKPYDPKVLLLISAIFMAIGFAYLPLYSNTILRYCFTAVLIAIIYTQKNRIISVVKEMRSKK